LGSIVPFLSNTLKSTASIHFKGICMLHLRGVHLGIPHCPCRELVIARPSTWFEMWNARSLPWMMKEHNNSCWSFDFWAERDEKKRDSARTKRHTGGVLGYG
jgi:hypothetical protein